MSPQDKNTRAERLLERAVRELQGHEPGPELVQDAARRVWAELGRSEPDRLRRCSDFQRLIPEYLEGRLPESRALLLQDHSRECIPCRNVLKETRRQALNPGAVAPAAPPSRTSGAASHSSNPAWRAAGAVPAAAARSRARHWTRILGWGVAAGILFAVALYPLGIGRFLKDSPTASATGAVVRTVDGSLLRISGPVSFSVTSGEELGRRERVRTARGARAVIELEDGSRIEMKERSELSLSRDSRGTEVYLERGDVIVEAAPQRFTELSVITRDCTVSVTGTVFAVNRGARGSRVSVLEGEVRVAHQNRQRVLKPGQQFSTYTIPSAPSLHEAFAWSADFDRHLEVLKELAALRRELEHAITGRELRYSSRLLDLVPEDTAIYAALPNVGASLGESYHTFRERIAQSPALHLWWEQQVVATGRESEIENVVAKIREAGSYLGEEIVVAFTAGDEGGVRGVACLAEIRRPVELQSFLQALVAEREGERIYFHAEADILIATPSPALLQALASRLGESDPAGALSGEFHAFLLDSYQGGAGWLVAVDARRLLSPSRTSKDAEGMSGPESFTGSRNLRFLRLETKKVAGESQQRAVLSFDERRSGLASWIAEPSPMGSLDFVSPEAYAVAAVVTRDPVLLLEDLVSRLDEGSLQKLLQFQLEHGLNLESDVAAPLGGEFLLALDGPILPKPSWKLVIEVYDPVRFQRTLEWAAGEWNREAAREGKGLLQLTSEVVSGRTFFTLSSVDSGREVHYLFSDGYLVAAPGRTLLIQTLQLREVGYTLSNSTAFLSLLPEDNRPHYSAILYQNAAPILDSLASLVPPGEGSLSRQEVLETLLTGARPTLLCLYSEEERIIVTGKGNLVAEWATLMGLWRYLKLSRQEGSAAVGSATAGAARTPPMS